MGLISQLGQKTIANGEASMSNSFIYYKAQTTINMYEHMVLKGIWLYIETSGVIQMGKIPEKIKLAKMTSGLDG